MMDPKSIHVVHTTHPLSQELFRMTATPRAVIEANESRSQVQCAACFTIRNSLPTCQRCKSVWYCSKECQKKDWPRHKLQCTPSERPKGIQELVKALAANITLVTMLQVCAALDLDLNRNREVGFKVPFMARVDIAIEPSDVHSFVKILLTDEPYAERMEGMIQINHFSSHIPGQSGNAPLTKMRDNMWRAEREKLKPQRTPLGLIEFVNNSDFSITMPLPVCDGAMKMAKGKEPFVMISGRTEKTVEKSMTVDSCMEYMNLHIRSDKQNQLKLRTEMIEMDKAIVRSARDKSATQPGAQILRKKLARESLYANLPLD